jgi:transcriptional regulator with XRE-family HTH domain
LGLLVSRSVCLYYNLDLSRFQGNIKFFLDFVNLTKKEVEILFWDNFVVECAKKKKSPAAVAEELGFSNSMPTSWKNGALPRMSSRKKIADYFGITVDELMGTKKEPAGMGGLKWEWADVEAAYKNATPEARAAAKAAALAVLENGKAKEE